jgi:hypothetical protein
MYGSIELNCSHERNAFSSRKVLGDGVNEMLCVDADGDEDVQCGDFGYGHRYETAMRIVNQEITSQSSCGVIVYTARAIRDIAHYECAGARTKAREDIGYGGRK